MATTPGNTLANCGKLVDGDPDYTFGLSDWKEADLHDVRGAVVAACGERAVTSDPDGPGWIDPDSALAAIEGQRNLLAHHARAGSRVLLATGHPTGLLWHYIELAQTLASAGCQLLCPLDDEWVMEGKPRRGLRFFAGVACVRSGADLLHSHRSSYMEAMLQRLAADEVSPDLVVGDHGMAGAAIERGIEALAIADVNDPALFLAEARGRTAWVLPIDDNLAPRVYEPITAAMLDGSF